MSTSLRRPTKGSSLILTLRGRVNYKVAVLRFEAVKLQQASYLACLLSPYRQSSVLRLSDQTYCQHSLHPQTLLLVGSHAASSGARSKKNCTSILKRIFGQFTGTSAHTLEAESPVPEGIWTRLTLGYCCHGYGVCHKSFRSFKLSGTVHSRARQTVR